MQFPDYNGHVAFLQYVHKAKHCHKTIPTVNNSDKQLYVIANLSYPDTTFYHPWPIDRYHEWVNAKSSNENTLESGWNCHESNFIYKYPADTLMVWIFDVQENMHMGWDSVIDNHVVLQNYYLSIKDLQSLDWRIYYPPTPEMRKMKMWPPYGTY